MAYGQNRSYQAALFADRNRNYFLGRGLCMTDNRLAAIAKIATFIFRVRKIECNFITNPLIDSSIPGEMPSGEPGAEFRVPKKRDRAGAHA